MLRPCLMLYRNDAFTHNLATMHSVLFSKNAFNGGEHDKIRALK